VIITYHTQPDSAAQVIAEITGLGRKAVALKLDVGELSSFDSFYENVRENLQKIWSTDKFDFLINNAGHGVTIPFAQVTEEAFDRLMNVHFKGVYFLTQKALAHINDHGSIINLSSGTTRFCVPGYSVYSSLKSAMETFTRYLSKEVGSRGINANIIAPGPIETDFNNAAIRSNPQMKAFLTSQTPLGRVGNASDIGPVAAFLCSDGAKWINGQRIEVSGGIN
jgi:NAD(P)-dependent dehydrogenase (short-subunit alcohol dehydrogenase family)